MRKKAVYRTAIINKFRYVTYVSDLLFGTRDLAIKRAKEMYWKEEGEPIETHKWEDICIPINDRDTWFTFEKVINDRNERYIGIITETLVLEE